MPVEFRMRQLTYTNLEQGCTVCFGKGSQPLLWVRSRVVHVKNTANCVPDILNYFADFCIVYIIYKYDREPYKKM